MGMCHCYVSLLVHFLLFLFQLDARLVVCDEKFDQRLHIGEWDWNIFICFGNSSISHIELFIFSRGSRCVHRPKRSGMPLFWGGSGCTPISLTSCIFGAWRSFITDSITYNTRPYHIITILCCLGVFDAESFCWLRCSPGAGAEFLPSPDDLSPALLAEILSRWLGDSRMGRCDSYCRLM